MNNSRRFMPLSRCFLIWLTAITATYVQANPEGGTVVGGTATIGTPSAGLMEIQQSTDKAIINWQSFSNQAGETVRFVQPSQNSAVLNRVTGNNASVINGALEANGNVYLINHNGVMFGRTARVDVGGLVTSTLDISNESFQAGQTMAFEAPVIGTPGNVVNQGVITTGQGGSVVFVGSQVTNEGSIRAPGGQITLGEVQFGTSGLVSLQVKPNREGFEDTTALLGGVVNNHHLSEGALQIRDGKVVLDSAARAGQNTGGPERVVVSFLVRPFGPDGVTPIGSYFQLQLNGTVITDNEAFIHVQLTDSENAYEVYQIFFPQVQNVENPFPFTAFLSTNIIAFPSTPEVNPLNLTKVLQIDAVLTPRAGGGGGTAPGSGQPSADPGKIAGRPDISRRLAPPEATKPPPRDNDEEWPGERDQRQWEELREREAEERARQEREQAWQVYLESRRCIDPSQYIYEDGFAYDGRGNKYDRDGFRVDADGNRYDSSGRRFNSEISVYQKQLYKAGVEKGEYIGPPLKAQKAQMDTSQPSKVKVERFEGPRIGEHIQPPIVDRKITDTIRSTPWGGSAIGVGGGGILSVRRSPVQIISEITKQYNLPFRAPSSSDRNSIDFPTTMPPLLVLPPLDDPNPFKNCNTYAGFPVFGYNPSFTESRPIEGQQIPNQPGQIIKIKDAASDTNHTAIYMGTFGGERHYLQTDRNSQPFVWSESQMKTLPGYEKRVLYTPNNTSLSRLGLERNGADEGGAQGKPDALSNIWKLGQDAGFFPPDQPTEREDPRLHDQATPDPFFDQVIVSTVTGPIRAIASKLAPKPATGASTTSSSLQDPSVGQGAPDTQLGITSSGPKPHPPLTLGQEMGILREAARGKGNFSLGTATVAESNALGKAWVGEGHRIASDGKTLVSADGLRTYRPPSAKTSSYATTGVQANFEKKLVPGGQPISNGHLNIQ